MKKKKPHSEPDDLTSGTDPYPPELLEYFSYCFYKSAMKLRAHLNVALQKYKIVTPQLGIMRLLSCNGRYSQVDLGNAMGIDKASMVRLIDGLVERGYLIRGTLEGDKRVRVVELTAKGSQILDKLTAIRQKIEFEFLAPLTMHERTVIETVLKKLLMNNSKIVR